MGSCLSKKASTTTAPTSSSASATQNAAVSAAPPNPDPKKCDAQGEEKKAKAIEVGEESVQKEIFVIKHRKSHDKRPEQKGEANTCTPVEAPQIHTKTTITSPTTSSNNVVKNIETGEIATSAAVVRTSSCTKEEVDAILIQCGRLSRSSSGKATSSGAGRKYSGSKRSYDFDHRDNDVAGGGGSDDSTKKGNEFDHNIDNDEIVEEKRNHRQNHRGSRASSQERRRRTPSRERSGSRDRGSSTSNGRRVSRSPARRSENPPYTTANAAAAATTNAGTSAIGSASRPGKMVSVPATVSSLVMDKSNNEPAAIKRISVKRNAGAASPRSQSPAKPNYGNGKVSNENHNSLSHHQPTLSRSSSRKTERSPYRRNPLSDIDTNSLPIQQPSSSKTANNSVSQAPMQKPIEDMNNNKVVVQGANTRSTNRGTQDNKVMGVNSRAKEQHQQQTAEAPIKPKGGMMNSHVELTTVASGAENLVKPQQTLTRSRSSRRSRDLDLNPETLLNPTTTSYTTLLLEDIQNFHQNTNNNPPSFSLPPCVTKACSILEAVADLNSCTPSNLSSAFSEDRKVAAPFVESEVVIGDDLMEPSLHKYVTVRRGPVGGGEREEEQESSGSNSFVGSQQHWSSSSWEPNSANSTDRWTSRSNTREDLSPLGFQSQRRHALSESGCGADEGPRRLNAKGHTLPTTIAASAST